MAESTQALQKNQILQASQHLLTMLDSSKRNLESVMETMPNLYAVINLRGSIVKCNQICCDLMAGVETPEDAFRKSLSGIFPETSWKMVSDRMHLIADGDGEQKLEVSIVREASELAIFNLHIRRMQAKSDDDLFEIFGVDVTAVRSFEKQLSQIFTTIPLGIVRVGADMCLEGPYSAFTETVFGESKLEGKNILDLLFKSKEVQWTKELKEQHGNLSGIIGFSAFQFDILRDHIPKIIKYRNPKAKQEFQWIRLNYDPILEDDLITGLLVTLEDCSDLELAKEEKAQQSEGEEKIAKLFSQVKRMPDGLRKSVMDDLGYYKKKLHELRTDIEDLKGAVHSIKGIARSSGLDVLTNTAHQFEDDMNTLGSMKPEKIDSFKTLNEELDSSIDILHFCTPEDSTGLGETNGNELQQFCRSSFLAACNVKNTDSLSFSFDSKQDFILSGDLRIIIKDACNHVISNSVAHGFEEGVAEGAIQVSAEVDAKNVLKLKIVDNGRGIAVNKLKRKAVEAGAITGEEAQGMKDNEALDLVFHPGLSTKDESDTLGGRGVGLHAVRSNLQEFKGEIKVKSIAGKGTTFVIKVNLD